ncbi:MAG: M1 family peptidase, partial [Flavobacteriales bacterium]
MNLRHLLPLFTVILGQAAHAQITCWQQRVEYTMDVKLQVKSHQYEGSTKLVYFNESPDPLNRVFFHLYNNAFQPNSAMDIQSRTIADPDWRVGDRISMLTPEEQGFLHVKNLKMNGKVQTIEENETILE